MSAIKIEAPKNRDGALYARVKKENELYVKEAAKKAGVSASMFIDQLLTEVREKKLI